MTIDIGTAKYEGPDATTQQLYQDLRVWLTENNIPIAHSVENFNALINTFYGRETDNEFAYDLMSRHFEVYTRDDGSIDPQAAVDINNYLKGIGAESHAQMEVSFSTDSGPVQVTPTPTDTPAVGSGIMGGGQLTKITGREGEDDLWGIVFNVAGVKHVYTFNSYQDVLSAYGDPAKAPGGIGTLSWDQITDPNTNTWLLGDADAFIGQTGTYGSWWDLTMYEAGLEAGIRNPGLTGEYLSQPEIQQILALGAAGEWSNERIQAEIRRTDYYQNTLYPGISTFLNQGIPNPENAYWNYMSSVESSLAALGYERDGFGTYRNQVGTMLTRGIDADAFNAFTPTFIRAEQSGEFASALNAWTERDLGVSLDFDNWFDVLAGNAAPEIADVVEKATIQFQADLATTSLSAGQISRLAELTQLSEQQMTLAFSNAEEQLLSVGQADLERYGLSQEALVNAAFGVDTGDRSATDIQRQARKAATELGIQDDEKVGFFLGFDRFGRPNRQGLGASAPEVG